jgi:plasmid stabilization system protein ParE
VVVWTLPAKNDLRQIYNTIAYDSKIYAKRVTQNIAAKPDMIKELPLIGKAVPELNDKQIREIAAYTYRIIYEVKSAVF